MGFISNPTHTLLQKSWRDITTDWTNVLTALSVRNCQMLLTLRICIHADLQVLDMCLVSVILLSSVTPKLFIQSTNGIDL